MANKRKAVRTVKKKRSGVIFKWWYALVLVLIVAVGGIVVIRLSEASGGKVLPSTGRIIKTSQFFNQYVNTTFYNEQNCAVYRTFPADIRRGCEKENETIRTIKELYDSELVKLVCDTHGDAECIEGTVNLFMAGGYCVIPFEKNRHANDDIGYAQFWCEDAGITPPATVPVTPPDKPQLVAPEAPRPVFKSAPITPPDPTKGENDGKWQPSTRPAGFWTNPALPGTCAIKQGNRFTNFASCEQIYKDVTCGNYNSFVQNLGLCDPSGEFRRAQQLVSALELNRIAPIGNLDYVSCENGRIVGWAMDKSNPALSINVDLYFDGPAGVGKGVRVSTRPTSPYGRLRTDANQSFGGSGYHGFEVPIPGNLEGGPEHSVHAYAIGIKSDGFPNNQNTLIGSKTFRCN